MGRAWSRRPIRRRHGLVLAVAALLLLAAGPARAVEAWLAAAVPGHAELGPARARGAVIWLHGRSATGEDALAPTPPYIAALGAGGWDAFRFNRLRPGDTLAATPAALLKQVRRLKQEGYRRVALAGQSFGGFVALVAADADDAVDAVVLTAPAAYGNRAEFPESWRENATQLYPLLDAVRRARVMAFYFRGDAYDPGGRGERTREILAARHLPHLVVDRPAGLQTHWAATTADFSAQYARCILGFLDAASLSDRAACSGSGLYAAAPTATVAR